MPLAPIAPWKSEAIEVWLKQGESIQAHLGTLVAVKTLGAVDTIDSIDTGSTYAFHLVSIELTQLSMPDSP